MPGMRMSSTTTSGWVRLTSASTWLPFIASPTTSNSPDSSSALRTLSMISWWSSASRTRERSFFVEPCPGSLPDARTSASPDRAGRAVDLADMPRSHSASRLTARPEHGRPTGDSAERDGLALARSRPARPAAGGRSSSAGRRSSSSSRSASSLYDPSSETSSASGPDCSTIAPTRSRRNSPRSLTAAGSFTRTRIAGRTLARRRPKRAPRSARTVTDLRAERSGGYLDYPPAGVQDAGRTHGP